MTSLTGLAEKRVKVPKDHMEADAWIKQAQTIISEADEASDDGHELSHIGFLAGLFIGHPIAPFWAQHIYWHPVDGVTVIRSAGWSKRYDGADEDGMEPKDILAAPRPDPRYYWYVDVVRGFQNAYNVLIGWLLGRVPLLDGPGRVVIRFAAGQETLQIDFLARPMQQWARVLELTKAIEVGLVALEWLENHPPYDIMVRQQAQFQLDVEHMMEEIRG